MTRSEMLEAASNVKKTMCGKYGFNSGYLKVGAYGNNIVVEAVSSRTVAVHSLEDLYKVCKVAFGAEFNIEKVTNLNTPSGEAVFLTPKQ